MSERLWLRHQQNSIPLSIPRVCYRITELNFSGVDMRSIQYKSVPRVFGISIFLLSLINLNGAVAADLPAFEDLPD